MEEVIDIIMLFIHFLHLLYLSSELLYDTEKIHYRRRLSPDIGKDRLWLVFQQITPKNLYSQNLYIYYEPSRLILLRIQFEQ